MYNRRFIYTIGITVVDYVKEIEVIVIVIVIALAAFFSQLHERLSDKTQS